MRVPEPSGVNATFASPRAKPAAPPCPSKLILYEVGATTPDRMMRPLNLAETGPTRAVIATLSSVSETRSIDSQPGIQLLSVSGSLSAAHVVSTDAGTARLLDRCIRRATFACDLDHAARRARPKPDVRAIPRMACGCANAVASCLRLSRLCTGNSAST